MTRPPSFRVMLIPVLSMLASKKRQCTYLIYCDSAGGDPQYRYHVIR